MDVSIGNIRNCHKHCLSPRFGYLMLVSDTLNMILWLS